MDIFGWVWLANTKFSVLDFVSISYPWLHVIFRQGCGGQGNVAYHRQPIWRNTFCNLDEYIQKSWGGEKGEDCTMLHVTVGHYHSRQATSHPKAMRQPHPKSLSKSTIFFSHLTKLTPTHPIYPTHPNSSYLIPTYSTQTISKFIETFQ